MRNPLPFDRLSLLLLICISYSAAFLILPCSCTSAKSIKYGFDYKNHDSQLETLFINGETSNQDKDVVYMGRRSLRGRLGSVPPRCASKCGKCTPCKPVHVPVPPGTPVTAEYYPEAWRCKCGDKLYMP